jgi:uncharacterized protein (TIGR03382 family)
MTLRNTIATASIAAALLVSSLATSSVAHADDAEADTAGEIDTGDANRVAEWKSDEKGCSTVAAPATAGLALLALAALARRRQD